MNILTIHITFFMTVPDNEDFYNLGSDDDIGEDVKIIEKGK